MKIWHVCIEKSKYFILIFSRTVRDLGLVYLSTFYHYLRWVKATLLSIHYSGLCCRFLNVLGLVWLNEDCKLTLMGGLMLKAKPQKNLSVFVTLFFIDLWSCTVWMRFCLTVYVYCISYFKCLIICTESQINRITFVFFWQSVPFMSKY